MLRRHGKHCNYVSHDWGRCAALLGRQGKHRNYVSQFFAARQLRHVPIFPFPVSAHPNNCLLPLVEKYYTLDTMKTCWHHSVLLAVDGSIQRQAKNVRGSITRELSEAQQQIEFLTDERNAASSVIGSLRSNRGTSGRSLPTVSLAN